MRFTAHPKGGYPSAPITIKIKIPTEQNPSVAAKTERYKTNVKVKKSLPLRPGQDLTLLLLLLLCGLNTR